jgi:hypothetical protein
MANAKLKKNDSASPIASSNLSDTKQFDIIGKSQSVGAS